MEGNNNYDQLLPQSNVSVPQVQSNLLTDLAADDRLLKEYQQYQGKSVASDAINLSEDPKPVEPPKPQKKVAEKKKEEPKKQSNTTHTILKYALTALALFLVFFIMFYPKTAPLFSRLGGADTVKGIAFRGGILVAVYAAASFALEFFL